MRVGILVLQHESNTFIQQPTTLQDFEQETLLEGDPIREKFESSHHEVGGFFEGLRQHNETSPGEAIEAVPIFAARALPSGAVTTDAFEELLRRMFNRLSAAGKLDGMLVAPHGAMVAESHGDADGHWLSRLREQVGPDLPIIGTIDPHCNLSPAMVESCDALTAYRSNPHLDQRQRGLEAASLMVRTLRGEIRPTVRAEFPPLAINIERQLTSEPHLQPLYELADRQLESDKVLTNSIVLGFPYSDVAEMGSATICVTDDDAELAGNSAKELADWLWNHREDVVGQMISIEEALARAANASGPVCLLDMGDNVGGGSAADGTFLAHAIREGGCSDAFVCLYDPESVHIAQQAGVGASVELSVGGKVDDQHGLPLTASFRVRSMHDGRFSESQVRHGGYTQFDQGLTVVVETDPKMTVMLTTKRMTPFSLQQIISCDLDPSRFRILVAKGVNAPVAAYREVCSDLIRVNTPGSTCADMLQLDFKSRRQPLFPFECDAQ